MPNYDFHTLSPIEFERLCRDLIQARDEIFLESFAPGPDEGIDALTEEENEGQLILQCKRYIDSSYSQLKSKIKNEESEKIERLQPEKYILATAQSLTKGNKEELKEVIDETGTDGSEVLAQEDINNLLGQFPDIERQHYKLWLHSANNLQTILKNDIFRASQIEEQQIKNRIKLFVKPECFEEAKAVIEEENFCIIAGIPGIGKTTLAQQLVIDYVLQDDYQLIKIQADINEAFEVDLEEDKKTIYYYDDFLGQVNLVEKFKKNEESRLVDFINMIRNSENKKMIFTTRDYILNQAKMTYEKFDREDFELNTYVIDMNDYSQKEKAEILYNHIYWTEFDDELIKEIVSDRNYMEIIDHENFKPRIVEMMTIKLNQYRNESKSYIEDFLDNLDHPRELWSHAFNQQIRDDSRALLYILTVLPLPVSRMDLIEAFKAFVAEVEEEGLTDALRRVRDSLKELNGNFIA